MADEFPSRLLEKVVLRLPDGMRNRLKAEAEANKRSMNAEIVARLEASLGSEAAGGAFAAPPVGGVTAKFAKEVAALVAEQFRGKFVVLAEGDASAASRLVPARMPTPHELPDPADDDVRRIAERIRAEVARRQQSQATALNDPPMEEVLDQIRRILRTDAERDQASADEKKAG